MAYDRRSWDRDDQLRQTGPTSVPAKLTILTTAKDVLLENGISGAMLATALTSVAAPVLMPALAASQDLAIVAANAASVIQSLPQKSSRFRAKAVTDLTKGLPAARAAKSVGITPREVRNDRSRAASSKYDPLASEAYQPGTERASVHELEAVQTVRWAKSRMHVTSGTTEERYTLVGKMETFHELYKSEYLVRVLKPLVGTELQADAKTGLEDQTRLQQGISVAASLDSGAPLSKKTVFPRSYPVFWQILKEQGFKFRKLYQPYECEVCLFGPLLERERPIVETAVLNLQVRIKALQGSNTREDAAAVIRLKLQLTVQESKLRALHNKESRFKRYTPLPPLALLFSLVRESSHHHHPRHHPQHRHKMQYVTQRGYMKEREAKLKPGQCVVYEDFVNNYAMDGSKVYNLVFTIVTLEGGVRKVRWVNNYCTDPNTKKVCF